MQRSIFLYFASRLPYLQEREKRQLRYSEILQRPFAVNLQAIVDAEDRDLHSDLLLSALTGRAIGQDYLKMVWSDPQSRSMYDVLSTEDDVVRRENLQLVEKSYTEEIGAIKQQVTDADVASLVGISLLLFLGFSLAIIERKEQTK